MDGLAAETKQQRCRLVDGREAETKQQRCRLVYSLEAEMLQRRVVGLEDDRTEPHRTL